MGLTDFFPMAVGLLMMMVGLATTGYLNGSLMTLVAVLSIIAGTLFIIWGETRRS